MNILEKLQIIQTNLRAPKSQYNAFGKYNYRNCEDILEALKPILQQHGCTLIISDELVIIGSRYYVKAISTLYDCESCEKLENTSFAREDETKKGMDSSQITGAASSYARKYSLNGLFGIDDTKDSDFTNKESEVKEFKCVSCEKKFISIKDKNGKTWTPEQLYKEYQNRSPDNKARCKECSEKLKSQDKGGYNE